MDSLTDNKIQPHFGKNTGNEDLEEAIENLWKSLKSASKREKVLHDEYQTQSHALSELNSLKIKYARQSSDINQIKLSKTDLEKRYSFARDKISEFEKKEIQYNSQKDDLQNLRSKVNNLQEKIKDTEFAKKEISRLGKEVISRNREIDELKHENAKANSKLYNSEDQTQKNTNERKEFVEKINYLVARNDDLKGRNVGLTEEIESLRTNINQINKDKSETQSELNVANSNLSKLEHHVESYKSEMNELRKKVNSQTRTEVPADSKKISELENEVNYSNSRLAKAEQILEELNRQITQRDEIIQKLNLNETQSAKPSELSQRSHEDNSKLMEIIMAKDIEISKIDNELSLKSDKLRELNVLLEKGSEIRSGKIDFPDERYTQIKELQNHQKNLENVIENKSLQLKDLENKLSSDEIKLNREEKITIAQKIEAVIKKVENLSS
jgi:DNA repair exonuclease SbcCD ATPase subunit